MIESYAFLAAFAAQILAMSALVPDRFIKRVRALTAGILTERFEQVNPGVDRGEAIQRFLTIYRMVNLGIAVLGLLLLGRLFIYTQDPNWAEGVAKGWAGVYFILQCLPPVLISFSVFRHRKLLEHLLEGKRKATLHRRGLFDFISPIAVVLAVLAYILFVACAIYVGQNRLIVGISLFYAVQALLVYRLLYARKVKPYETPAARMHAIGRGLRTYLYFTTVYVVYKSLKLTLVVLPEMHRWEPFVTSAFFVVTALIMFMSLAWETRKSETDGLDTASTSGT